MFHTSRHLRKCVGLAGTIALAATACGSSTDDSAVASLPPIATSPTTSTALATTEPSSESMPASTVPSTSTPLTTSEPPMTEPTQPDTPPTTPAVTPPAIGSGSEFAIADLAARLNVDAAAITVVSVEAVTWPDGSLGCPQPGMSYTQALVDGTLIVLLYDGITYEYHSGGSREPFYCPPDQATAPGGSGYGDT